MKNLKFEEPKFAETEFETVVYACCESNATSCDHNYVWNSSVILPWQDHYGQSSYVCTKCGNKIWR